MVNKFILKYVLKPFARKWFMGFLLLFTWTAAFIALPSISGWFLAACSIAFITANALFSYLAPSAIIRLLALARTATRYFEKVQNHRTSLDVQQSLQLKIFESVAKFPYFRKQANNNSSFLENSTQGIDLILNHILLWILPLTALVVSMVIAAFFLTGYSYVIAIEFLISSALMLFIIPQIFFRKNSKIYKELKAYKEENQQELIQSFRGRIEVSKYGLEGKVIDAYHQKLANIDKAENKLQINSFNLQLVVGFGLSVVATFIFWQSSNYAVNVQTGIGIFLGIMAQAELAEMLFSGKSERSSVEQQIKDIQSIFKDGDNFVPSFAIQSDVESVNINEWSAKIPETTVRTSNVSLNMKKGEWTAIFGETGKGKTTFLNSLFYPEYHVGGTLCLNDEEISHLMPPQSIYVTQKAYLLTGTLRENFQGYNDEDIERVLEIVDLKDWRLSLTDGLETWLGENGETLSGGQRKKLLLAQALLKNPQVLVVDEPTAGISTENAMDIFHSIRQNYPNSIILMATHLKDFEKVVDRRVYL